VATIAVGVFPYGVAVNPVGPQVYVANNSDNTLSVIDTTTNTVTTAGDILKVVEKGKGAILPQKGEL